MYFFLNAKEELMLPACHLLAHLSQNPISLLVTKKMNFHMEAVVFPGKQSNIVEKH